MEVVEMRYELALSGYLVPAPEEGELIRLVDGVLRDLQRHGLQSARVVGGAQGRLELGIELAAADATAAFLAGRGVLVDVLARRGVHTGDLDAYEEPGGPPLTVTLPQWRVRVLATEGQPWGEPANERADPLRVPASERTMV
jgi:hypothetical protein